MRRLRSLDSPRCCEGVNTCGYTVPVKGRRGVSGEGGGGEGRLILVFIRPRAAIQSSDFSYVPFACIIFPSFHAAVGAYSRLDAVSSIIASSHSLMFLLLTSFSPESAVAAFVSQSQSVREDPCWIPAFSPLDCNTYRVAHIDFNPASTTSFHCAPHSCHHVPPLA